MTAKILFIVSFLICSKAVLGQTALEIEAKYGEPTKAYSVSTDIWMTPEFLASGQICRMSLYPKRVSGDNVYLSTKLPFEDFKNAVDLLVPIDKRGTQKESIETSAHGANAFWTVFEYEKVTIQYSVGVEVRFDSSKRSKLGSKYNTFSIESVSPIDGKPEKTEKLREPKSAEKLPDGFQIYRAPKYEVVTISWNNINCTED